MQNPIAPKVDYLRYVRLFWKRKWLVILPAILFPLAAGYYAMQLPDRYRSTTLILVQPQKVPAKFVPSTVSASIRDRLQTISQQIFSRTRLEQIIQEFNLFERERERRTPEEIIETMRSRIQLQVHRNDAFRLSYIDPNPRLAMLVTNKLASLFIEENLKVREQQAIGTSQFLADEIDRYRRQIREREKQIYEFKQKHMAELPEQLASNQARLNQLQNQLQINTQNINAAEDRRLQLQRQIAEIERRVREQGETASVAEGPDLSISQQLAALFQQESAGGDVRVDDSKLRALRAEREKMEAQLEGLLLRYTEKHPDVVRLKSQIRIVAAKEQEEQARLDAERERLRQEQEARKAEEAASPPVEEPEPEVSAGPRYPPVYERLKADLLKVEATIARLQAQNEEIQKGIEKYQARIAAAPARQLQLRQLSEDYDNVRAVLESLINKKLQADLAENLERKQKGEQFKILDPANLPEKPFYPNRLRYVQGGLLAGLALGVGFVLLLDFLDASVRNRQELLEAVDAPVLAVIPEILTAADVRRRWTLRLSAMGVTGALLITVAGVVHLKVKPLPQAVGDLYTQVKNTHWTTVK